jgi:hypothetical protein
MSVVAWLDTPVCSFFSFFFFGWIQNSFKEKLKITTDGHGWNLSIPSGHPLTHRTVSNSQKMRRFSRHLVIFSLTWKWWHTLKVGTQIIPVCVWRNQRIRTHITKKKVCFYFCLSCFFPHHSNCHHTPDTLQKYLHLGFPSLIVCWQLLLPFFFFTCPFYRVGSVIWITIAIGGGGTCRRWHFSDFIKTQFFTVE